MLVIAALELFMKGLIFSSRETIASYLLSEAVPEEICPQVAEVNNIEKCEKWRTMKDFLLRADFPIQLRPTCTRVMQVFTGSVLSLLHE